ncbi:NYN domain-containing protein [bacterium]|nr:NYN domain-containing protein [bacterium]
MTYIIDANNLAGKLKILGEVNFDKKLIRIIKDYNQGKGRQIMLVFDGYDSMGDKIVINEKFTVIYSPRDRYCSSADDKICELVERIGGSDKNFPGNNEYVIVTEDNELINRIEKIKEQTKQSIKTEATLKFIERLRKRWEEEEKELENRGLEDRQVNKINKELLKIWQ